MNIGSDNGTDKRSDAVEHPETVQQNIYAAQEEIERIQMERDDQRNKAKEIVKQQVEDMLQDVETVINKKIIEKAKAKTLDSFKTLNTSSVGYGMVL